MARLFGREFSRDELGAYLGTFAQVGGIRPIELASGRGRGARAFEVSTGTGLTFTVLADRALDIGPAQFRGRSLAFQSPAGFAHPAYYEPEGAGWLRTFGGGLMATCGLSYVGAPGEDGGESFGIHGRVGTLPADEMGHWTAWRGDECLLCIKGTVTEGAIFRGHLRLTRQITARLGGNSILVEDAVENLGGEPAPFMLLYHCNMGFPLLSPDARLIANSTRCHPRDPAAASGLDTWSTFSPPTPGFTEQVFYQQLAADHVGDVRVALVNPALDVGLGLAMTYRQTGLPCFTQWKMLGHGTYVLGLEPGNCHVEGRVAERAAGRLQVLQPGETHRTRLEFTVLEGLAEIEAFEREVWG